MIAQIVQPYEEQRAHPRIVRGFALRAIAETESAEQQEDQWIRSSIIDISLGGCSFLCDVLVEPNMEMVLDIQFPERRAPFRIKGPILRCEHNPGLDTYKLVVQFVEMERAQRKEFASVLDSYISSSF